MPKFYVIIEYDTGDTFNGSYAATPIVLEYDTQEEAVGVAEAIREHHDSYVVLESALSTKDERKAAERKVRRRDRNYVYLPNGEKLFATWCGYFETLRGIRVEERGFRKDF